MDLLLVFSNNISLKDWYLSGVIDRELLLYKNLLDKGINVSFLTYGDQSDLIYSNLLKNIEIIPINQKNGPIYNSLLKSLLYPLFNYKLFKKIGIVKTNQIDGSWITWPLKLFFRKKLIIRCGFEAFKSALYEYKYLSKKKRHLFRIFYQFLIELISYNLANLIIMSNDYEKNFIIKKFRINSKKIVVIPNYIDTDRFKPIPVEKKEKSILFIGRLNEFKNLDNLIESFKYLDEYCLDIIGDGELKPVLIKKVKELNLQSKIKFLGTVPNSDLPQIINQYCIFLLPSNMEGNPKTLLEAMSCGVACIGTNIEGINQIITHRKNGYLCNLNSKSIANAIISVYNNKKLMTSIANNARQYIIDYHSIDKILKKELKVYEYLKKND